MKDYRDKDDRDHYDRPSWSEIDKKKNKSKHVSDDRRAAGERKKVSTGYSQYKDQLDQLFSTGEKAGMIKTVLEKKQGKKILDKAEAPERQKLLRAIREAVGERQARERIDEFMKKYGELPDDMEVLTQALLHDDDLLRESVLRRISKHLDGHILPNKALLLERVKNLAAASEDDAVRDLAVEVRKKLGG
jgi:hypothetical protein